MLRSVTCNKVSSHIAADAFVSQGLDRYDFLRCALELQSFLPMGKALRNRVDDAVSAKIFDTGQETFLDEFLMRRLEDRLHLRRVRVFGQGELPLKLEEVRLPLKTVPAIPNLMVDEPIEPARERRVEFPVEIGVQALKVVILE